MSITARASSWSGQELNDESYAICKADMLIKGQDVGNIKPGDTLADDGHSQAVVRLHALQSALRRGVEAVREGRPQGTRRSRATTAASAPDCPASPTARCSSCSIWSRRCARVADGGARFCIVQNGSPLFTGGAGSGESNIRQYLLETISSKPSSRCRPRCSTTPASRLTCGSSPTTSRRSAKASCS